MEQKRNAKCACGSGHKYKKCCGKGQTEWQAKQWQRITDAFRGDTPELEPIDKDVEGN